MSIGSSSAALTADCMCGYDGRESERGWNRLQGWQIPLHCLGKSGSDRPHRRICKSDHGCEARRDPWSACRGLRCDRDDRGVWTSDELRADH